MEEIVGRERHSTGRGVDDLAIEGLDASSYKKLSSGKYACLICPHKPVLDTPLMLSMHIKGSRHCVSKSKLKEKQQDIQDEINKRIALSECSDSTVGSGTSTRFSHTVRKPLIEETRKAASEILSNKTQQSEAKGNNNFRSSTGHSMYEPLHSKSKGSFLEIQAADNVVLQLQSDFRQRQERELKYTEAGWKRSGHGKWFKDENVEFDSDEEDPNVCLA